MPNSVSQRSSYNPSSQHLLTMPFSSIDFSSDYFREAEGLETDIPASALAPLDAVYQELRCARSFHQATLPFFTEGAHELPPAVFRQHLQTLAMAVCDLTETRTCCILLQNAEQSGYSLLYPFLSDDVAQQPTYTRVTPQAMSALIGSDRFISTFLTRVNPLQNTQTELLGFVLVADKQDGTVFTAQDQAQLERVAHYLLPPLLGQVQAYKQTELLGATRALALQDELTGLVNRRGFYEQFEREIERARRNPSSLCVAMIDVDHFKRLNDEKGHLIGDLALQQLARLLQANVRRNDWVCRFGGEEFVLLLPDTPLPAAADLMSRIAEKIRENVFQGGDTQDQFKLTISVGVAQVGVDRLSIQPIEVIHEALAHADEKLYQAKHHGRDRVYS